jgi:two-component system, chemotaxis family, CheB/CheR fusion protein
MAHDGDPNAPSPYTGPQPQPDEPVGMPPATESPCPIVGVGASAGGLEAFTQLLQPLPATPGLSFVLVQHLDPAHESLLTGLLSHVTPMPVQQIRDGLTVQPNQVYVTPPQADVVITHRVLHLISRTETRGLHMPIDIFFRSLAIDQGPHAIGIILSGGGSDGTLGLQDIKEHGGFTLVQDERTATVAGMPHSALMHGAVDMIAAPDGLAQTLMQLAQHSYVTAPPTAEPEATLSLTGDREAWGRILTLLGRATGVDFTAYKPGTIQRRVARRMVLHNLDHPAAYAQYVESHRDELEALYHDLLIKVTTFFRDPESFEALRRDVLPHILREHPVTRPLRLWVPGCATGEEAYSLAICVLEYLSERGLQHTIRLFATDLDESALATARTGLYIENIALDVSPERLRRFFVPVDQNYQVIPAVRELCVFARHNLYRDPPFSHLDLISCRNVLIYFNAATQRRVIPLLHYALAPGGALALGPSETIGAFTNLFTLTDPAHKIYTKNVTALPSPVDLSPIRAGGDEHPVGPAITLESLPPWPTVDVSRETERLLLHEYAPAAVLVNEMMDIVHFHGETDRYLRPAPGKPSWNLFRMARDGLLGDLRAALEQAQRTGAPVRRAGAQVDEGTTGQEVTIRVLPLGLPSLVVTHYLVVFETPAAPAAMEPWDHLPAAPAADEDRISRLHQELQATRLYLQSLMEQYEVANEELRAANEEVLSNNEELQSTNEELETAKEELQSTNEELITTNNELQYRNRELNQANNDLSNLFSNVSLPIVMVGRDLRIRRATAMAETVLHLLPTDIERPVGHLQLNLAMPALEDVILQVINTVRPYVGEVQDREGHWYSLQIRPYCTPDNQIDGAVLLLIDIGSLKDVDRLTRLLDEVQAARDYAERIVHTVPEPLVILDQALRVQMANQAFYETFHVSPEDTAQHLLYELGNGQWQIPRLRDLLESIIPQYGEVRDFEVTHTFDTIGLRTMRLNARRLTQEDPAEAMILLSIADITELTRAHDYLQSALQDRELLLRELHHRVKNNLQLVSSLLRLQADALDEPAAEKALEESQRRIQSLALVHEQLSISHTLARINMPTYIQRLATSLVNAYAPAGHIGLHLHIEEGPVTLETAIPCALILTELLSNALQHAFPAGEPGEVSITWRADAEDYLFLSVQDTGIGMPAGMDIAQADSLGLSIVQTLVQQLDGRVQVDRAGGTTVAVRFPLAPAHEQT